MIDQSEKEAAILRPALTALITAAVLDENDICAQQVPIIRSRVDVVCIRIRDSSLISIELKKNNWLQAYAQARRHGAWSHRTYIAIDSSHVPDRYHDSWSALGIGIILTRDHPALVYRRSPRTRLSSLYLSRIARAHVRRYGELITSLI